MDTNQNPFAFLAINSGVEPKKATGGGDFAYLQSADKPVRMGSIGSGDLGSLAKEEGVDHLLPVINAIYGQESGAGANSKTSTDGARGGMQIMPDTFRRFAKQGESIDNPADNMRVGLRIIKSLGDKFGNDPAKIATGYFSGEGNVNAGNGAAWKNDHKDGNGKSVSGYVSDVLGRLSPVKEAKAAENLPDLNQIPKWSEISTSERFLSLPDEEKTKLKGAYFDDVLAPHAGAEAAKAREQFMAQRDTAPGFNEKLDTKLAGIVPAVQGLFGLDKKPGTGSVMAGYNPAATQSGAANLQDTMATSKTLRDVDASVENRRARLVGQGEAPEFADRAAREAAAAGVTPGAEIAFMQKRHGTVGKSDFDFETSDQFKKQTGLNNPLVRGAAKAGLGTTKALSGYTQFMGDVLGIDGMQAAGKDTGAWARGKEEAIGEKGNYLERNLEGAINSIGQQLPLMIAGVSLETQALPLAGMAMQTFGQEYSDGRSVGQTPAQATQRAAVFAAFEVIGEKFGLGDSLKAIKAAARGMPNDQIVGFLWSALKKEVPGELLTTTGQFATDKLPGIGLNQAATGEDYLKQVGDTIAQTIMQSGVMAGGTTGVSTAVRYLRDKSDNANVDAIHAEDVRQKSLDRWNAGLLGVPREAVQSVQTPDGRIEPNTAPATPQQTAAAEPAPIDVHPTSAVADSIVADLATQNGIPYEFVLPQQKNKLPGTPESNDVNDQDVLDYAEMRHRQLLAKLHGRIEQVPTDSGLVDQEVPGQALTPEEQAELNTLETQNPSEIRSFYGMNQPIPSDQSANQSFAQTPAPAVAPVEQPAQGSVFPTATEPGLVAAQENQHAQNIPQATPNGSTPSQAAIEPTGQPVRPAQEQQPTGQGAAAQANPVNPVGIANQQVQPDDSVTSEFDVSGRNDQQLSVLATKGQPGWKEAALAELAKRGISQEPAAPKGQFKTADEAQAYIQAQRRRAGSKLPKALPLPHEDGSFGVVTDGQSGWEQAVAYAKANAPKTEKESRERRSSNVKKSYDVWDEDGNKGTINIVRSKDGSLFRIFQIWTNQDGETAQFEQSTGYGEGITDDYIVKAIAEPGDLLLTNPNDKPKTEKEAKAKREKKGVKTASVERMDDGRITLVRHNADGTELSPMYFDDIAQAQRERINWERGTTSHETPLATQESDIDAAATSGFSDAQSGKENRPGSELNDVQVQAYNIGYRRGLEELNSKEPKTEKEAKAKRQQQQSVEPKKATEDSLKAASEWWSVHSAADRKSLLLEQYSEAIAATNSELTWDELGSGMQTRIAELYDARQVKPWTGERKTEQDVKIRRKAEEIHAKANDLLGGTFKLSVDQVETLIHDKGMEVAEQTLAGLKQSVKDAEKRNKTAKPKEQTNGTEAAETKQAEEEKPQAPDTGTGETISQKPKTENISKGAKASRDVAAKADQPVVDGVEAIAAQIQQSIAEHNIKANEKIAREQVAKGHITQEQADADLDRTRKMWEGVKPNERTLALAKAVAAKDPRPLVGAWAKEGQGTYGIEGSVAAFEDITGVKLLRLGSAARAKAIFDWAGWSEDQVVADIAERRKSNAEQKAAYEAKRQKEDDERIEKRAASEMVEFRDTGDKKGIKDYIDGLIEQGFNRIITSKVGAITKTYLANEKGTGYPLPVGLLRDYADVAVRKLVASKTDATADKPKTEKEAKAKRDEMVAFKHAGLNIYPVKVGGSLKWAVQTVDNAAREKAGERQIGGDAILDSKESAIAEAERFIKQAAADEARLAEIDAAQQQEVAAKAEASEAKAALLGDFYANKERIVRDRAAATLAKMIKSDGKVMTRADLVKSLIADGSKLSIDMVNKIKPMSRTQFNRASSAEQRAHEDKIKQGGKVSEYMIGNFVVSKTEYDYAEHLLAKSQQPEKKAEKSPKPAKTEKSVKADKARQQLEAHFTPGNIVYNDYWKTHNRVLGFDWNNGNWSATEEEVKQQDGKWVAAGDKRTHSTSPGAKDKVVEQAAKETSAPAEAIADFGEKIGGARKDVWSGFKDGLNAVKDADIATEPLSKVWPAPDYQKLIDSGIPAESVSAIRALRDEIPQKPRSSWKVKRWADQVKVLRDLSNDILNGSTVADLKKIAGANTVLDKFFGRVDLYQAVGHEKSLQGINLSFHHYTLYKGQENVSLWSVEQDVRASAWSNWPREIATGKTKEEAIEAFKKQYAGLNTEKAAKTVSFDIYTKSSGKGYWIGKKAGRNILPLEGPFETLKEARSYKTENTDKLVEKLAKVKEIPNERRDSNDPRVGADMRNGQDVTPQMFGDTFGFRGVEFGNWVEQGKRQQDLNDSYDALMDMAAILGLPPKALSLNGELGLAFGARGTGGTNAAKAHYELDFVAINMTKKSGAGSLGHEWWHAVDNYFSRMRDKPVAMMTEALDVSLASRGSNFELANDKVRREMIDAFGAVVSAIKQTAIKARSSKLDAKRSKQYWTTTPEMSARAFESYLISKLQDQNAANDYLANIVDPETWKAAEALGFELDDSYPYPTAGEIPAIRAGFDKFFETVETKSNEHGGVTMFSRSGAKDTWYQSPLKNAFEQAPDRIFGKAPQLKLWLASNAAKLGVKKEEIEWSGINEFLDLRQGSNVSKHDLLDFLSNNGVKVVDEIKGDDDFDIDNEVDLFLDEQSLEEATTGEERAYWQAEIDRKKEKKTVETKYDQYVLPGGTNYKELLLTLPERAHPMEREVRALGIKKPLGDVSGRNIVEAGGSQEMADRWMDSFDGETFGKNYTSSHWGEKNVLAHIRFNDRIDADGNKVLFIEELQSDWAQDARKKGFKGKPIYAEGMEGSDAGFVGINSSGVPEAPFIKDTKAWVALAIKRMVAYAAENGYDKVAFVNGKQSADRYGLAKQIDTLHYNPTRQTLVGTKDGLGVVNEIHVSSEKLDGYVGKEVADRILSQEPNEHGLISLKGHELEVGGEGMKSFYDKIVPQVANDVLKKLGGGKVEPVEVARSGRAGRSVSLEDRQRMKSEGTLYDQTGFAITPAMREMVGKGLPLFSRGRSGAGMAVRDLKAVVDRARASLKNLPMVHVMKSPESLDRNDPVQSRLYDRIKEAGAENDVEGAAHDGEIYMFSDNLADEFRAEHVLVNHEVGHYGLREVFGKAGLDPILNTIYMTNGKVRKQADALRDRLGLASNAEATEEVLVEMEPKDLIKLNAWRRLVRHIRDWLNNHGFGKMASRLNGLLKAGMTEQQKADMLVADVINAARGWVRNGTPSQSSTVQETKLSQADQNDSDLLERDRANIETAARRMGQFVDEFLDGKVKDSDTYILGDTPAVLRALGAEDRKMQIDGYTIHKILDGKHRYFITPDMLKQIPDHLYDPLAVFDSPKDGKPGKIVLTELSDAITGKPVIVAVHLSKKSGRITVNEISSVYETSDGTQRSKLTPEALEYYRNEKSLEQTTTPNLSTPLAGVVQSAQDLGKNILTESDIVKQYGPKFSRKPIGEVVRDLQSNVVQFYGNQDLKTFNGLNRTINTQFHKALKDKDFGRVYNLIQGMQNHVATASARPAELAPGILHRVDNVIGAVKTLVSKSQRKSIEQAGEALFAGTLAGKNVTEGKVWAEQELRDQFGMDDTGVALYKQARTAIDASLDELAAAEAYALAENYLPKAIRNDIIESPEDAASLIIAALDRQIAMASRANLDEATQASMADAKDKVKAIFDQNEKLKKAGYAPLMRFGKFDLKVQAIDPETGNVQRDEDGNPVTLFYSRYETQAQARAAEAEQKALYADKQDVRIQAGVVNESANELYRGVSPETLSVFADAVGARQAMDDYIRLVRSERSAMKRQLGRKGTEGYTKDVQRVLANFITSNARQAAQQLYGTSINQSIRRIPKEKGDVQKEALDLRNFVISPEDNGALFSSVMFSWFLGGSPAAALVNLTQPITTTLPYLSQYGAAQAFSELTKAVPYAMGSKQMDAELRAAIQKASLQGVVDAQEVFHLYAMGSRSNAKWLSKLGFNEASGQAVMTLWGSMFASIEGLNRRATFIAAWNIAKNRGENNPFEFAVDAVNQTQGIYNKANRPNLARSTPGRIAMTFKTFQIAYLELMNRQWNSGVNGKKAVLIMMAVLILASGINGLPFADDLDDIIDTIGQWMGYDTNMKRWKRRHAYELLGKVAGDLVLYGASSLTPLDFGSRLGLGNVIPGTGALKKSAGAGDAGKAIGEVVGASAGFAQQMFDAAATLGNDGDIAEAAKQLLPKALKDAVNAADMLKRGYGRDYAGNKTVKTDSVDAAVKAIGFNPTVVAQSTRASMPVQQDMRLAKAEEASIVHAWAQAVVDGDHKEAKDQAKRLTEWNRDNPDTPIRIAPDQIRDKVRKMTSDKATRITKTAPKEMRGRIGLELMK